MSINNWLDLVNVLTKRTDGLFPKLLVRVNQSIRGFQRYYENFSLETIRVNHLDIFNQYSILYYQLLIEIDVIDIMTEIKSLDETESIIFNMISVGKWIKVHNGNADRIFFFDTEKTIISDKSLADFLNRIEIVKKNYMYFGSEPKVYYKFKMLPSDEIISYMNQFGVEAVSTDIPTPLTSCPRLESDFDSKVLLDQSILLTLCSNLSHGLSESFYKTPENKTKEIMVENKRLLDDYISDKTIIVSQEIYDQAAYKISHMCGILETARFVELKGKIEIVPECINPRFTKLTNMENITVSIAERDKAIIVTSNQRLCHKIDDYYPEIRYRLFWGLN